MRLAHNELSKFETLKKNIMKQNVLWEVEKIRSSLCLQEFVVKLEFVSQSFFSKTYFH